MDYEKKYKEALNKAKELMKTSAAFDKFTIEHIFPELKEDDDEKIRKVLIDYFKRYKEQEECGIKTFYGIPADDILAWLEKQGVQPRYNIGDVICDKSCTTLNKEAQPNMEIVDIKNGMYICDKGSFPVSQQDEYELVSKKIDTKLNDDSVSNELRAASVKHAEKELKNHTFPNNEEFELIYTFEEGAKWNAAQKHNWSDEDEEELKIALNTLEEAGQYSSAKWLKNVCLVPQTIQKPTEWSEEDEEIIRTIISDGIRGAEFDMLQIGWLKSLKERYTWKPSDEQMDALDGICSYIRNKADWEISQDMVSDLYKLSEQLKKLKGE